MDFDENVMKQGYGKLLVLRDVVNFVYAHHDYCFLLLSQYAAASAIWEI